jgi:MFS family permease
MRRTRSDAPEPGSRGFNATLGLLALAVFIGAVDRGNLATAAPLIKDELHFSATRLGFLLAAYYITYVPAQIVVGWLVDRVGAARVLATGFVAWSLAMSLTGAAHGFATMVWLRLALGIGEAAFMPAASAIVARCFPETGRGTANGVVLAGLACGPAFGVFFGGMLIAAIGWRAFFIGFGLASVAWLLPWLALVRPRLVERHPAAPRPRRTRSRSCVSGRCGVPASATSAGTMPTASCCPGFRTTWCTTAAGRWRRWRRSVAAPTC